MDHIRASWAHQGVAKPLAGLGNHQKIAVYVETILFPLLHHNMESSQLRTPSPNRNYYDLDRLQVDTLRKTRFFDAIDENNVKSYFEKKLLKEVYLDQNVSKRII